MKPTTVATSYVEIEYHTRRNRSRGVENLLVGFHEDDDPLLQNASVIDLTFLKAFTNLKTLKICGSFGRTVTLSLEGIENCHHLESLQILTRMVDLSSLNGLEFCSELKELQIALGGCGPPRDCIDISSILGLSGLEALKLDDSLAPQPSLIHLGLPTLFPCLTVLRMACSERDLSFLQGTKLVDLHLMAPLESLDGLETEDLQFLYITGHKELSVKPLRETKSLKSTHFDWSHVIDRFELDDLTVSTE